MAPIAAIALLAGTSLALAQASTKEAPASGAAPQHAPSSQESSSPKASDINREPNTKSSPERKSTQTDQKVPLQNRTAQETSPDKLKNQQSTQEHLKDEKPKSSENDRARDRSGTKAEGRNEQTGVDSKPTESRSQTAGQAGAGAKLSTEQRTKITSVIREQKVQPETNVNFSVSVGTRVPKTVHFHPLPPEIITVYPDWRGYEFFLVRDEIVVVNPRTLEIVAVLEV
jgi:hypothetical protein